MHRVVFLAVLIFAGDVQADEIVQLYLSINDKQMDLPISTLIGLQRLGLSPGESGVASFEIR